MMRRSALYQTNTLSWNVIVLADRNVTSLGYIILIPSGTPWSYGSWIYNYLCNQCLPPLMLWVRISIRARCTTLCDKDCQWLATTWWFSPGPPVFSTNRTNRHHITEILFKVLVNTMTTVLPIIPNTHTPSSHPDFHLDMEPRMFQGYHYFFI
jgi:hypothetical protein